MKQLARQFGVIFFLGFFALSVSFGYSVISTGTILGGHPLLAALRALGLGIMAAGLVLWIVLLRSETGKTGLNTLFGFLIAAGLILLALGALFPMSGLSHPASLAGLGFTLGALVIGLIVTLVWPAYPTPVTKRWPEGGELHPAAHGRTEHDHAEAAAHEPAPAAAGPAASAEADDLTKIEGIGPRLAGILGEAGIRTFAQLAATAPEEIARIVTAAGFKAPFNPATWPRQAELAARGDWEELAALWQELLAGRSR